MEVERRKLTSFAPDQDPISKDVVLDMSNFYPTTRGYRVMPGLIAISDALPDPCMGAFSGAPSGGSSVIVAGTKDQLYLLNNATWVSQGLTCTPISSPNRWRFTMYGVDLIACNGVDPPFVSINGANFTVLGGSPPISSIPAATDNSIFLIQAGTFTWWSSLSDVVWTLDIATQTVSAPFSSTPGPIIAAKAIRGGMALYKKHSFSSTPSISGPPFFYEFGTISREQGVPSGETVVAADDMHYWWGQNNFYRFDGYNLTAIPNRLREFFIADFNSLYDFTMWGRWDESRTLVFWHYSSVNANPAGTLDKWICLNTQTGEWGMGNLYIEACLDGKVPFSTGLTYDQFGTMMGTYDAIPAIPYNSPMFGSTGNDLAGLFLPDHVLYVYQGTPFNNPLGPQSAYITSSDFGDRRSMVQVTRLRPGWSRNPGYGYAEVEVLGQYLQGTTPVSKQLVPMSPDGNYNVHVTDRLMRFKQIVYADAEICDYEATFDFGGEV